MMNCVEIFAIRHGETDWNADGRLQGQLDISLNDRGLEQAQLLAQSLTDVKFDAIYSSDLARAFKTAQTVAKQTLQEVLICKDIRERHFGRFQGMTFAQIEENASEDALRWRARDIDFIPGGMKEGGESLRIFSQRVLSAVNDIANKHLGQKIALVTHGGVLDVIYRAAMSVDWQAQRTWTLGNTCVSQLSWSPQEKLRVLSWASTKHLDDLAPEKLIHTEPNGEF